MAKGREFSVWGMRGWNAQLELWVWKDRGQDVRMLCSPPGRFGFTTRTGGLCLENKNWEGRTEKR